MNVIPLSLLDLEHLNSPEVIMGLISVGGLLIAIVVGFFYKRAQSKKSK